jgi:hypothetical protein
MRVPVEKLCTMKGGIPMLKSRMLVVLPLAIVLLAGCAQVTITGSGAIVNQEETITGFDRVEASHGFQVDLRQGDAFGVTIRVDDNVVEHLEVTKKGDTLRIGLKRNRSYTLNNTTLEAEVTMPELTGLKLSGGSHATISGFTSAADFDADLSGGSHLRGDIEAGDAHFDLSGGSHLTLSGSAQDLKLDASGGGQIDLSAFSVVDANVELSGGARATVNPSGTLDVDASGGSHVTYVGNPTLGKIDTSGGSSVERE